LNALAADEIPLGIFSNKPHTFTAEIVSELFPAIPWCAVLGHQANTPRKPDPSGALQVASSINLPPADIFFVGDSTVDYETAVNAGMQPLLVDWGYHDRTALENTGAPIVSSANQILPALAAPRPDA
jgi:phosphoglycolate phosphatase